MTTDKKGRFVLRTRVPPNLQILYFIWFVFFVGIEIHNWFFSDKIFENKLDGLFLTLEILIVISPAIAFQLWLNKTQTSYYDNDTLYFGLAPWRWRKMRFVQTEIVLRYADIAEIITATELNLQPFAYVRFRYEGNDWVKNPFLSRFFLRDEEIKECLRFMYTKVPDKYPLKLIEFMNTPPVISKSRQARENKRFLED